MVNGVYNISSLFALGDVQQLVIPEVQRDYVWEEKNCNRLFHSIKNAFEHRKDNLPNLSIIENAQMREDMEYQYIQKNSRVNLGFIYAYYDSDYIGKQFIIDGQQRFTTIYLLILATHNLANLKNEFLANYFKNSSPKIDYKVREASHDFLKHLILDQCNGNDPNDFEKKIWWRPNFENDITIKNLKNNYTLLLRQVNEIPIEYRKAFLHYLLNNIDLKFFNVPVSEQGEQLYLFMNSRGMRLNFQEKIRAEIIAKHGLECGIFWENAQQYFWEHKIGNKDSELGFNEFIKWTIIINVAIKGKDFNKYFALISRPVTEEQLEQMESYIIDNIDDFSREFFEGIFNATTYFFNLKNIDSVQNNPIWLTSPDSVSMPARFYLKFIPIIYYIYRKRQADSFNEEELRRVSAFIINCNQSRTYQKNPQLGLLNFIKFINDLCDQTNLTTIMDFDINSDRFIGRDFSKKYFTYYNSLPNEEEKSLLENFVIEMINNAENQSVLDFLHGDYRIIIDSLPENVVVNDRINLMKSYCVKLNWFISLDINTQRKLLLTFGDYAYALSDIKFDFGQDKESWGDIFTNQSKTTIFENFLNNDFEMNEGGVSNLIDSWHRASPISSLADYDRFYYYLIKYDFDKNYFAWGWSDTDFFIRTHTVRKTGYNYSIDIMNYLVSKPYLDNVYDSGWVDGSRDKSIISIASGDKICITLKYLPTNWEGGIWEINNKLEHSDHEYSRINVIINNLPSGTVSPNDDIVEIGRKILSYILENIK